MCKTTSVSTPAAKPKGTKEGAAAMGSGGKEDTSSSSSSPAMRALKEAFPEAISNPELVEKVSKELNKYGYDRDTTLLATSLCCDEVNRVLGEEFQSHYSKRFNMGGLAGFPFGGVTSFGAMAHHIPDGGSCLIVFGPHVGIDSSGQIGKVDRRGRMASGACCGSAAEACNYVCEVRSGKKQKQALPARPLDAQQAFVRNMLMPYGRRLCNSPKPQVDLPKCVFTAMDDMMRQIVTFGATEVAGEGTIALLGGIQINTPNEYEDYFVPIKFQIRDNNNLLMEDLMWNRDL